MTTLDAFIEDMCDLDTSAVRPYCIQAKGKCIAPGHHVIINEGSHGIYLGQRSGVMYYNEKVGSTEIAESCCVTHVVYYKGDSRRERHDTIRVTRMVHELDDESQKLMSKHTSNLTFCVLCRIGLHDDLQVIEHVVGKMLPFKSKQNITEWYTEGVRC